MLANGYVHKLIEDNLSFESFVWECAKAFGALDSQKEFDSLDLKSLYSSYYCDELQSHKEKLIFLQSLTEKQKLDFGKDKKYKEIEILTKEHVKFLQDKDKIRLTLDKVNEWQPPSDNHLALKQFMLDSLKEVSFVDDNYYIDLIKEASDKSDMQYYEDTIAKVQKNIEYYTVKHEEEKRNNKSKLDWLETLNKSVQLPNFMRKR